MNPIPPTRASADGLSPNLATRLNHLFRHSLRVGRIHPLYPAILKHRRERPATPEQP